MPDHTLRKLLLTEALLAVIQAWCLQRDVSLWRRSAIQTPTDGNKGRRTWAVADRPVVGGHDKAHPSAHQMRANSNTHAEGMPEMIKAEIVPPSMITLALDWLPNTNHTGFFVAQVRCVLRAQDISLKKLLHLQQRLGLLESRSSLRCA